MGASIEVKLEADFIKKVNEIKETIGFILEIAFFNLYFGNQKGSFARVLYD